MNKILELIKNEKVEWKKLKDIAYIDGAGVDKKIIPGENKIKLLNYMDVYKNLRITNSVPKMIVSASDSKIKQCNVKYGDIFVTPSSETKEDIFISSVVEEDLKETVYSYHITRIRLKELNYTTSCFINYLFSDTSFREKNIFKKVFGNTRMTIAKSEIENIEIPIPSLETQEKIVHILDNFTNYVDELSAELSARNSQYEYYRNMLLSDEYLKSKSIENSVNIIDSKERKIEWRKLGDICNILDNSRKPISKNKRIPGSFPYYGANGIIDYINDYIFDGTFLLIGEDGSVIKENKTPILHWIENSKIWVNNHAHVLSEITNKCSLKYIYHYLSITDVSNIVKGIPPKLNKTNLYNINIPIPSINIQNQIVRVLDKFSELAEDTKGLLPKEIEQRQKQYEYYREKLLSFGNENNIGREREREREEQLSSSFFNLLSEATRIAGIHLDNKIEFKKLGNLLDYEQPTKYIVKSNNFKNNEGIPILTPGKTFILGYTTEMEGIYHSSKENPVILFDDFTGANRWIDFNFKLRSSALKILKPKNNTNLRYCYYYLQILNIEPKEHKRLWLSNYSEIEIPIPSLNIQNQIVRVLDKFSELAEDTKGLLPKEIEQRQKQYEYYREKLLSFANENNIGREREREREREISNGFFLILQEAMRILGLNLSSGLEYKKLEEICEIKRGRVISKKYLEKNKGNYPVYSSQTLNKGEIGRIKTYDFDGEYITWTTDGAYAGTIFYRNEKFSATNICGILKPLDNQQIVPKFLSYFLEIETKKHVTGGSGNPKLMSNVISKIKVPIPSLKIQQNIVKILDQFQELIENTNGLLTKEIKARQKQYNYYRKLLLEFKKR
ncbi:restriction endonuclease subunit S [[Mycoplasma] anseris]|uniref:Type I restriction modification DNA specificity domain-containing protein n=2 Tax=[Mycoplasma] anseris TaxID=92400 RepID=A0A2Z4NDI4_9BACT|nr:restriction endonuclease subunit S [[Mycoplasma] anseris]AWX69652.1 hypothetical protein DP065_02775 [[Mycoplasma] anseris]